MMTATIPESATPAEVWEAIRVNIDDKDVGETGAANYVVRCLTVLGQSNRPVVSAGRIDTRNVRLYTWETALFGRIILVVGTQFLPRLVREADITQARPGVYTLVAPDQTKTGQRVVEYAARVAARPEAQAARSVARDIPPARDIAPAAPRAEAPARAPRAPRPPRAVAPPPPAPSEPAPALPAAASSAEDEARLVKEFLSSLLAGK